MTRGQANRVAAIIPFVCSAIALVIVLANVVARVRPQPDENASAHLWQLLMAGQLPIIGLFALTADWRQPTTPVKILLLQGIAAGAATAAVWLAGY